MCIRDRGECIRFSFADIKEQTDRTAAYFSQLGIGRGDMVMLILKRRFQFWIAITALHKIGATVIPATHLLTEKDIVYRCNAATIKAIVAVGDPIVIDHILKAKAKSPSVEHYISIGPIVPDGWHDFNRGLEEACLLYTSPSPRD